MIKYYLSVGHHILLLKIGKYMYIYAYTAHAHRYIHHIPPAHILHVCTHICYMHSTHIH